MNRDPGRDRAELEDLVQRARIRLRDWTDANDHDPGVALLELLAYVADLVSSYAERISDESYLGSRGRHSHCGVHRGTVVDNADPLGRSRLFVRLPDVTGDQAVWAVACLLATVRRRPHDRRRRLGRVRVGGRNQAGLAWRGRRLRWPMGRSRRSRAAKGFARARSVDGWR